MPAPPRSQGETADVGSAITTFVGSNKDWKFCTIRVEVNVPKASVRKRSGCYSRAVIHFGKTHVHVQFSITTRPRRFCMKARLSVMMLVGLAVALAQNTPPNPPPQETPQKTTPTDPQANTQPDAKTG